MTLSTTYRQGIGYMAQSNFASGMADDIDPRLLDFIERKVNTFVKWDLIRFFHDNPHAMDTAENIAGYIGRDVRRIDADFVSLVEAGVLELQEKSGKHIYRLSNDTAVRELINQFVTACHDRSFRVKAINHMVHSR